MKSIALFSPVILLLLFSSCKEDSEIADTDPITVGLSTAFSEFDENNTTILLDGDEIVIETNGLPNHTSPYWSNTRSFWRVDPRGDSIFTQGAEENHSLFIEPTLTNFASMAPGYIDDFNGSFILRVPVNPQLATNSSRTGLGPIGISVTGSVIYNDQEGPNVPLDNAAPSLDYTGAHTGPQSYHYHLEPKAWSDDDDALIGILADGFFLYGRKCHSTGDYPDDLDASGGHVGTTQHSDEPIYHYHIQNELYLNQYHILFPGDYQGTPNAIN